RSALALFRERAAQSGRAVALPRPDRRIRHAVIFAARFRCRAADDVLSARSNLPLLRVLPARLVGGGGEELGAARRRNRLGGNARAGAARGGARLPWARCGTRR